MILAIRLDLPDPDAPVIKNGFVLSGFSMYLFILQKKNNFRNNNVESTHFPTVGLMLQKLTNLVFE